MRVFANLRALFSRGTLHFNSLELRVLRETMRRLDPGSAKRMQRRMDQVNLVQRLEGGEEVNSYQMVGGRPNLDRSTALRSGSGESLLASFSVTCGRGERVAGRIWLVDGVLFSLEFDKPTEGLLDAESLTISVELAPVDAASEGAVAPSET
jgi:hypothetical protein